MSDKTELLNKLRLDRSTTRQRSRPIWPWAAVGIVLAAGGFFAFSQWSAAQQIAISVAIAKKLEGSVPQASSLDASGYVVARRQATVASKITAKVTEILIEEGQHVSKDQVMARLDDSNIRAALAQAEAQHAQAEAALTAARIAFADQGPIFQRSRELHEKGWVSGSDYDQEHAAFDAAEQAVKVAERNLAVAAATLTVAQRNQDDTVVRAPYDGIITVKAAQPGEVVSPLSAGGGFTRTGIGTLVDMDSLEVEVDVSENFIERTHSGQDVVVRLNAYPDWQIPASVIAIIPTADRSKATVKVRVGFKQRDERILPEMGARVSFLAKSAAPAQTTAPVGVLVPVAAIVSKDDKSAVFVVKGDHVERRAVQLGGRRDNDQVILQGLSGGEAVALGDLAHLQDGVKVRRDNQQ